MNTHIKACPLLLLFLSFSMHTAVNANIISVKVQSTAGGNYFYQSQERTNGTSYGDPLTYGNSQIAEEFGSRGDGSAGSFDSVSSIDGDEILFKNGNAAYGAGANSTSRTVVDIEFQNTGSEAIRPTLVSQILPAGMGLFMSNCSGENLRECQSDPDYTFANLDSFSGGAATLMSAEFNFTVLLGATELYSLSGSIAVEVDDLSNITVVRDVSAAERVLDNFRLTSIEDSQQQVTYDWGATDFEVIFPNLLAANEIATLSYIIEVNTTTSQSCSSVDTSPCPLAYAAFGDPIGRGGASRPSLSTSTRSLRLASFAAPSDPLINGYEAGLYRMAAPTFEDGILTYRANSGPGIAASSVNVSEPSVFALLALGVGFLSLRRKR